jgi:hypothetical protein
MQKCEVKPSAGKTGFADCTGRNTNLSQSQVQVLARATAFSSNSNSNSNSSLRACSVPPSGMTANFPQGQMASTPATWQQVTAGFPAGLMMVGPSQTPQPMGIFPSPQEHMIRGSSNRHSGGRPLPSSKAPNPSPRIGRMMVTWGCCWDYAQIRIQWVTETRNHVFEATIYENHCLHEL